MSAPDNREPWIWLPISSTTFNCYCFKSGTTPVRTRTNVTVFGWFLVVLVLFLLLRGCEGGRRKHAFIGNGGHFTGSSVTQMRTRAGGISKEEDFIAKGKSELLS